MEALHKYSLLEIRALLSSGELKASKLLEICLARIKATEPRLHAAIGQLMEEEAWKTARELDKNGPDPARPLWGLPVMLADSICVKGHIASGASRMLANYIPVFDAFVVEKLRAAGAILIAKNNMDELGLGVDTGTSSAPPTANPRDERRVAGSSGSAAAVTAFECYGALGGDTGGSLLQSAAFCGCVGLRPSYGRVSRYGVLGCASSMDQVGPLARDVADAALLYEVIAGYDPREATSAPLPARGCLPGLAERRDLKGLRIGLPRELWQNNETEVDAACRAALNQARELGAELLEISLPNLQYAAAVYNILSAAEASTNLARLDGVRYGFRAEATADHAMDLAEMYMASRSLGLGEAVKKRIILGNFVLSAGQYERYYQKAARIRRLILEDFKQAFASCNILAAPVSPRSAWLRGEINDTLMLANLDALTAPASLAGLPALSIPALGANSQMPVGLQLIAPALMERELLEAGQALFRAI